MHIKNLFNIGDIVSTKSNGERKVVAINTLTTKNGTIIQYLLEGFNLIFFYEEDLKLIQRG